MSAVDFAVTWNDAGRKAQHPADPRYPDGIDIDLTKKNDFRTCKLDLPYPAKGIGHYEVECRNCGLRLSVTAAGRADDPRSIKVPCKRVLQ